MSIPDNFFGLVVFIGFTIDIVLFLFVHRTNPGRFTDKNSNLTKLICLSYIVYAFTLHGQISDVALFSSVGYYLRHGIDFYFIDASHGTYPFFPFLAFYYIIANYISEIIPFLTFSFLVKLILIPAAYILSKQITILKQQILFLLNPILFGAVVVHGQADILLLLFLWLSIKSIKQNILLSGLAFGASVLTKTWSVIIWPLLIWQISITKFIFHSLASISTIFVITFIYTRIFSSSITRVLSAVTGHPGSPFGFWGISLLLTTLGKHFTTAQILASSALKYYILYTAVLFFIVHILLYKKHLTFIPSIKILILFFNIFTLRWGVQYSLWILPFAYLDKDFRKANNYSLFAAPYILSTYFLLSSQPVLSKEIISVLFKITFSLSLLPWIYSIIWLVSCIKYLRNYPPTISN